MKKKPKRAAKAFVREKTSSYRHEARQMTRRVNVPRSSRRLLERSGQRRSRP
jgi:hypothetical protein